MTPIPEFERKMTPTLYNPFDLLRPARTLDGIAERYALVLMDTCALRIDHWDEDGWNIVRGTRMGRSHVSQSTQLAHTKDIRRVLQARENIKTIRPMIEEAKRGIGSNASKFGWLNEDYVCCMRSIYSTLEKRMFEPDEEGGREGYEATCAFVQEEFSRFFRKDRVSYERRAEEDEPSLADMRLFAAMLHHMACGSVALITKDRQLLLGMNEVFSRGLWERERPCPPNGRAGVYTSLYRHEFYPARQVAVDQVPLTSLPGGDEEGREEPAKRRC